MATAKRWRGAVARLLTVLGALLVLVSIAANFVERQALDTGEVRETAEELISDPVIQQQVASTMVDRLFTRVDVEAELEAALPQDQKALAGVIAGGMRPLAERLARELLERPRLQQVWVDAVGVAQAQVVRVLDDEATFVETEGGVVSLDLRPLLVELTDQLPIVQNLADRLPPDAGLITIFEADQLQTAQDGTRLLRAVADWIWVLALLCWIGAVYLARNRRREVQAIAFAFLVVGLLVLAARRLAGAYVADELSVSSIDEEAINHTWDILTRLLFDAGWAAVVLGLVALVGAWLVGGSRHAARARRALAPVLQNAWVTYGIGALVFLGLFLWSPISVIERPAVLLVLAILLAAGIEVLRRLTARELAEDIEPPRAPPDPGDTPGGAATG